MRGVTDTTACYLAKLPVLPESPEGMESIQLFPPGTHDVVVTNAKGEPVALTVAIDQSTAETLEAARAKYQAEADAGSGDAPFLDFNHEDREASAWVKAIAWAGDDPQTGGIRATVELTESGRAAIAGKTFRRVSPAFHADPDGKITGAPANMGGFVNRAAFRTIAPLFAKESQTTPPTMNEEQIKALSDENAALKTKLDELETRLAALNKKDAEAAVEMAAKEGRIGTDPTLKAKWVDSIIKDPAAKDLLLAMAPNPALAGGKITDAAKKADAEIVQDAATLLAAYNDLPREEKITFFAKHSKELIAARESTLR